MPGRSTRSLASMNNVLQCANCKHSFPIHTFPMGMSRLEVYPCAKCSTVLAFELPYQGHVPSTFEKFRCECGGEFRRGAPFHCPSCNAEITMATVKSQINWSGSADGYPGVCVTKCIDDFGHRWTALEPTHAG